MDIKRTYEYTYLQIKIKELIFNLLLRIVYLFYYNFVNIYSFLEYIVKVSIWNKKFYIGSWIFINIIELG